MAKMISFIKMEALEKAREVKIKVSGGLLLLHWGGVGRGCVCVCVVGATTCGRGTGNRVKRGGRLLAPSFPGWPWP